MDCQKKIGKPKAMRTTEGLQSHFFWNLVQSLRYICCSLESEYVCGSSHWVDGIFTDSLLQQYDGLTGGSPLQDCRGQHSASMNRHNFRGIHYSLESEFVCRNSHRVDGVTLPWIVRKNWQTQSNADDGRLAEPFLPGFGAVFGVHLLQLGVGVRLWKFSPG